MDMIFKDKKIACVGKKEPGAKETRKAKRGNFFAKLWESCRPKAPEELLERGNARRKEAKINLQEKGDAPEAIEERLSIYRAALANFDKARKMVHGEAGDLRREIRANRAECHLEMGYLYGLQEDKKPDARRHYEKTVSIACAPLRSGNAFDERTKRAAEKADIGLNGI